jgi:hypothetical protein
MKPRPLHVARGEVELGSLDRSEALELLEFGFLLPTDLFREAGAVDWRKLSELKTHSSIGAPLAVRVGYQVASVGQAIAKGAGEVSRTLRAMTQKRKADASVYTRQLLENFLPQIQALIRQQRLFATARTALHDEELMRKTFGAVYDCLPKPAQRFISERDFVTFCLERRKQLFVGEP